MKDLSITPFFRKSLEWNLWRFFTYKESKQYRFFLEKTILLRRMNMTNLEEIKTDIQYFVNENTKKQTQRKHLQYF